jgi:hypothetical protein
MPSPSWGPVENLRRHDLIQRLIHHLLLQEVIHAFYFFRFLSFKPTAKCRLAFRIRIDGLGIWIRIERGLGRFPPSLRCLTHLLGEGRVFLGVGIHLGVFLGPRHGGCLPFRPPSRFLGTGFVCIERTRGRRRLLLKRIPIPCLGKCGSWGKPNSPYKSHCD